MIELSAPPEPRDLLRGRVAVVTAAAGTGIGFATARRLALEGASVMISDRHEVRLAASLQALRAEVSTPVAAMPCDVTDGDQIERLYDATEAELGPIDVAFNNAGLGGRAALVDMTDESWFHVLDVTLNSAFRCTRSLMRRMIPRGSGTIINIASVTAWRAEAEQSHYGAAKAAVAALTRCAAMEAAPYGIRINAIAPTITLHENLARAIGQDLVQWWGDRQAQGRVAQTAEIAAVIAWLASDYASYLTGEVVSVSSQRP
ncbi:MAG: SDR family oxidoreductase [Acidimicrobiales bacterium]